MAEYTLSTKVTVECETNKGSYRETLERHEDEGLEEYIERVTECLRHLAD